MILSKEKILFKKSCAISRKFEPKQMFLRLLYIYVYIQKLYPNCLFCFLSVSKIKAKQFSQEAMLPVQSLANTQIIASSKCVRIYSNPPPPLSFRIFGTEWGESNNFYRQPPPLKKTCQKNVSNVGNIGFCKI